MFLDNGVEKFDSIKTTKEDISESLFQLKEIPVYAKYLRIYNLIAVIVGILLCILGILVKVFSANYLSLFIIILSLVLVACFLFGNYSVNCYEKAAENETTFENIDQSSQRSLLNMFIYDLLILFFLFLLTSIICIFNIEDITSYIDQLAYNKKLWKDIFGELSYSDVMSKAIIVTRITGILCGLISLYICLGLYLLFNMLDLYRGFQVIVQFFCCIFFAIGMCFQYAAQYAYRLIDIVETDKSLPDWIPFILFIVSIVTILVAIIGYIAHYAENKKYLRIFGGISIIFTFSVLVFSVFAFNYGSNIKNVFMKNCDNLMDFVEEDFLKTHMGCGQKYSMKANDLSELTCNKNRILYVWENYFNNQTTVENQKDEWGCLDEECCSITYSKITNSSNVLSVIAVILFISGLFMSFGTIYVYSKLDSGMERAPNTRSNVENGLIVFFVVLIAGFSIVMSASLPKSPKTESWKYSPVEKSNTSDVNISNNTFIKIDVINETISEKKEISDQIKNNSTIQEKNDCKTTGCPEIKYFYELSSNEGRFIRNNSIDYDKIKINITDENQNQTQLPYYVKFNGNVGNLNGYTEYFNYDHDCPLKPAKIRVKIYAKAFAPVTQKTLRNLGFLENGSEENSLNKNNLNLIITNKIKNFRGLQTVNSDIVINPIIIDVSNMKVNDTKDVLDEVYDFSFVSEKNQTVTGFVKQVILNDTVPIKDVDITLQNLDFAQCSVQSLFINSNGFFISDPLYVLHQDIQTQYMIKIVDLTPRNLQSVETKFTVGGFGYQDQINLGEISLWQKNITEKVSFTGITLDASTNKHLVGVSVSLYEGQLSEENDLLNPALVPAKNTEKNKLLLTVESNEVGNYTLPDMGPGRYTVVLQKPGHYIEYFSNNKNSFTK